ASSSGTLAHPSATMGPMASVTEPPNTRRPATTSRSEDLMAEAERLIPGGVNSPVRAFGAVGGTPPFIARADGAYLEDVDGRRYIDYVQSWGASLLGHARREIVEAAVEAARRGSSF